MFSLEKEDGGEEMAQYDENDYVSTHLKSMINHFLWQRTSEIKLENGLF